MARTYAASFIFQSHYDDYYNSIGSGTIDFDEFLIMMVMQIAEEGKTAGEEELRDLFRLLDKYEAILEYPNI